MNLREFVSESLVQVVMGVRDAQEKVGKVSSGSAAMISPGIKAGPGDHQKHVGSVDFDIATTVDEGEASKAGAGLIVLGIGVGGQASSDTRHSAVSRIKFSVPVKLPKHK